MRRTNISGPHWPRCYRTPDTDGPHTYWSSEFPGTPEPAEKTQFILNNCLFRRDSIVWTNDKIDWLWWKPWSHLEDVISGQRLGGVPTEGHEVCSDWDGKKNDIENLQQRNWNKNFIGSIVQSQMENDFRNSRQFWICFRNLTLTSRWTSLVVLPWLL